MIQAVICDDEPVMLEQMRSIISDTFAANQIKCELSCFSSGLQMLNTHRDHAYDIPRYSNAGYERFRCSKRSAQNI